MECYLKVKDDSEAALVEKCWMKVMRMQIALRRSRLHRLPVKW